MSRTIPFVKVAGAGNDFILVDRRRQPLNHAPAALAREWCDRKHSIGADGLLLLQPSRRGNARMRIFNPDGSEARMCGNGLRCVAWYLHSRNHGRRTWALETGAGLVQAQVTGEGRVRVSFIPPKGLRMGLAVTWRGRRYPLHAVDTGVPHAVIVVPRLETVDLEQLGPFIRHHRIFKPKGTNVDLLKIHSPHRCSIRTYERGVERETLACGTGAVASVVIGAALGHLRPPVQVTTAGGEKLTVGFWKSRQPWASGARRGPRRSSPTGTPFGRRTTRFSAEGLCLEGSAQILFSGGIPL